MSFSIEGKTAIVTGAANGIGMAIARQFAAAGANVMMADKDEDKLDAELEAIQGEGYSARSFAGDLREKLTIANLLSATIDAFDQVDILVNGSRQVLPSNPLEPRTDSFETLFKQNVLANLRLSQLVAKRFIQQAEEDEDNDKGTIGAIINLSSIAADRTHHDLMAYSVSCAALNQMTRSLAVGFADQRIRVNAIAIGSVMSANLETVLRDDEELRDRMITATPLGRIAEAREAAEVAQFLASGSSGFVTGQIITVDGGRTLIDPLETPVH
jgi:7-alpha-hydroxysteroid dehydrogenase